MLIGWKVGNLGKDRRDCYWPKKLAIEIDAHFWKMKTQHNCKLKTVNLKLQSRFHQIRQNFLLEGDKVFAHITIAY